MSLKCHLHDIAVRPADLKGFYHFLPVDTQEVKSIQRTPSTGREGPVYSAPVPKSTDIRGLSSVGRALAWHARSQEFESPRLHLVDFLIGLLVLRGHQPLDVVLADRLLVVGRLESKTCEGSCKTARNKSIVELLFRNSPR